MDWERADAELEARLARQRERRSTMAKVMLLVLVAPVAAQGLAVVLGVATVFGLAAVVVPAVVVWIVVRGR